MRRTLALTLPIVILCGTAHQSAAGDKVKITKIEDLPRHEYEIKGTARDLVASDEAFGAFAKQWRSDVEGDLEAYDIQDNSTLKMFHGSLLQLDLLEGRNADALERILLLRSLTDKVAEKLVTGLVAEAALAAQTAGGPETDAYHADLRARLTESVAALPWGDVQEQIEQMKGMTELVSENVIAGILESQVEPTLRSNQGKLSSDLAPNVIQVRFLKQIVHPIRDDIIAVFAEAIAKNRVEKPDRWTPIAVDLDPAVNLSTVKVGIWDTGLDVAVFGDLMDVNTDERRDRRDNDGNGFVDDVHGIAYTLKWDRTPALLYPLEDAEARKDELLGQLKGFFDLQASVESEEVTALKQKLATVAPEDVKGFFEDLARCGIYVHGTHVAGIVAEGNPFVRLVVGRLTADHKSIPDPPPSIEDARKQAAAMKETVDYFKARGVRVVNMSWGINLKEIEAGLESTGKGGTPKERAELAAEIFRINKEALYEAMEGAPEILFVAGAGNEDMDISFDSFIPAAFDLPNVIAVGAVDQAGDPTNFTSFGEPVDLYANGYEVKSYVPGGKIMALSGTSMSSPNAANLAAKLLTIDPSLTPAAVVDLMKRGADEKKGENGRSLLLINPKRTVELLRRPRQG
jgi:subtilisin family serine protease